MRIGMMSAWNTDSGVAIHAELVGREWVRMGHELRVFTFTREDYHGDGLTREVDEPYVVRCFGTSLKTNYLDPRPILEGSYDVFVVQDLRMLPHEGLAKIFPALRRKAKVVVHVLHENHLPEEPWFYQFDWDAVIYFDERQRFIEKVYDRAYHIPFPCAPWRELDRGEARRRLRLPEDKMIVLVFAQRGYTPYLPDLPDHLLKDVVLLILAKEGEASDILEAYSRSPSVLVREEKVLSWEDLDSYVAASDAVILHKFKSRRHAVVSSTIFQLLGTGRPFLVPKYSDFFQPLGDEVLKYEDHVELGRLIAEVFTGSERVKRAIEAARRFVDDHSAHKVASRFIEVFEELLRGG